MDGETTLERLRSGDPEPMERLARAQCPGLLELARRLLGDEGQARDTVRQAFGTAMRSGWNLGDATPAVGLRRLVLRTALDRLRERSGEAELATPELMPRFLDDGHHERHPPDWGDADALAARPGLTAEVARAVARLPGDELTVLLLHDVEGQDPAGCARLLGVEEAEARLRLRRARQALRALLDPCLRRGSL